MKHFLLGAFFCFGFTSLLAVTNTIDVYANLTYKILLEYARNNPTDSIADVKEHMRGDALKVVMGDAHNMGYSKRRVLKAAYTVALRQDPQNLLVVESLNAYMREHLMWKEFIWYGLIGCSCFTSTTCLGLIAAVIQLHKSQFDPYSTY